MNTLTAINYSVFLSIWNVFCNCYYSFLVVDWSWFYLSDKAFVFMIKKLKEFLLNIVLCYKFVQGYSFVQYHYIPNTSLLFATGSTECVWGCFGAVQQHSRVKC